MRNDPVLGFHVSSGTALVRMELAVFLIFQSTHPVRGGTIQGHIIELKAILAVPLQHNVLSLQCGVNILRGDKQRIQQLSHGVSSMLLRR